MTGRRRWTQTDITDLRQRLEAGATLDGLIEALARPADDVLAMSGRLRLNAFERAAAPALARMAG